MGLIIDNQVRIRQQFLNMTNCGPLTGRFPICLPFEVNGKGKIYVGVSCTDEEQADPMDTCLLKKKFPDISWRVPVFLSKISVCPE